MPELLPDIKRLARSEPEAFLEAAYERSGWRGLTMRILFEIGSRMGTFVRTRAHSKTNWYCWLESSG